MGFSRLWKKSRGGRQFGPGSLVQASRAIQRLIPIAFPLATQLVPGPLASPLEGRPAHPRFEPIQRAARRTEGALPITGPKETKE